MSKQDQIEQLQKKQAATGEWVAELQSYLLSPKFYENSSVNSHDILHRISEWKISMMVLS